MSALVSTSGMWPPGFSVTRFVHVWWTHTEMHDNDRIRPRVVRAVQSTGTGRETRRFNRQEITSNKNKVLFVTVFSRHSNSHRRGSEDLPENYIWLTGLCPSPKPGWPLSCIWGSTPDTFSSSLLLRQAAFGFKLRSYKRKQSQLKPLAKEVNYTFL